MLRRLLAGRLVERPVGAATCYRVRCRGTSLRERRHRAVRWLGHALLQGGI